MADVNDPKKIPVVYDRSTAARVLRATRAHELSPRNAPPRGRVPIAPWTYGIVRAKVTTAIPGGTFTSPSTAGRAQIQHKNSAGQWADVGDPVEVRNQFGGGSIAAGAGVLLAWIGGEWFVVAADCP